MPGNDKKLKDLLKKIKPLAVEYQRLIDKPLGIISEVGELAAKVRLSLILAPARSKGYDAADKHGFKYEIKTRRIKDWSKHRHQRTGKINLDSPAKYILLVLLDENYQEKKIYKAEMSRVRRKIRQLKDNSQKPRNDLSLSQFIGQCKNGKGEEKQPVWECK